MTSRIPISPVDPISDFRNEAYLRLNARRLEHLASLALPLRGRTILELGAGIGDLTEFFLDRDCSVTCVEGRAENAEHLAARYAGRDGVRVELADLNDPPQHIPAHEVTFADGILYHLADPARFIAWCAPRTTGLLILSTCVSDASGDDAHGPTDEDPAYASQALDGRGCRPSRQWVYRTLRRHFAHAGMTRTQPNHPEFPIDWHAPVRSDTGLSRAVFVASHHPLTEHPQITNAVLDMQCHAD
ncbi:MAG: class I SAM-dependent methyltransferase [Phycisphaerales bacterium]